MLSRPPSPSLHVLGLGDEFRFSFIICHIRPGPYESSSLSWSRNLVGRTPWMGKEVRPTLLSSKRRPHFKTHCTNKNMVMCPDEVSSQEWLCWRGSAANYCSSYGAGPLQCFCIQNTTQHRRNRDIRPYTERNSNPRSQCSSYRVPSSRGNLTWLLSVKE
jgi:hypothetical protein